ncbi:MAG: nucleotidyltransferase [Bryobacteraceae bacterium]|jgi:predicted nucleotidyltransferase
MKISSDYKDLLRNLNAAGVRYLIVGGHAVMIYTEPSFTKDLDLWVDPSERNAQALFRALAQFGAPLQGIRPADFTEPEVFYQIGVDPVRIDVLTSLPGLDFASAWKRRLAVDFDGEPAPVISREDLITSKKVTGRARDRKHARSLRKPLKGK